MLDISNIAERLDSDEKLELTYRLPVKTPGGRTEFDMRTGRILDVAEEAKLFYVESDNGVIWVKLEEAVEIRSGADNKQ